MFKRKIVLSLFVVGFFQLFGCWEPSRPTEFRIVNLEYDMSSYCRNMNWRTWVEDVNTGERGFICGKVGQIGDQFPGCWHGSCAGRIPVLQRCE